MAQHSGDDRRVVTGRRAGDVSRELFRVLTVEPHEDMLELWSSCLEADGYHVSAARDADEGFASALKELPDLVITELALPRRHGFSLITQLHEDSLTRDVPVLVVTAIADDATLASARSHGAVAALPKPTMPEEMQAAVRDILAHTDPTRHLDRQLRRKLLAVRHLAQRFGASAELRGHLARFIDKLQQAVLLMDDEGRLIAASGAAAFLTGFSETLVTEHSVFDAIVAGESVSPKCWGRARESQHWSGCAQFAHRDGHTVTTRAVYMAAGVAGLHVAAFAPARCAQLQE